MNKPSFFLLKQKQEIFQSFYDTPFLIIKSKDAMAAILFVQAVQNAYHLILYNKWSVMLFTIYLHKLKPTIMNTKQKTEKLKYSAKYNGCGLAYNYQIENP